MLVSCRPGTRRLGHDQQMTGHNERDAEPVTQPLPVISPEVTGAVPQVWAVPQVPVPDPSRPPVPETGSPIPRPPIQWPPSPQPPVTWSPGTGSPEAVSLAPGSVQGAVEASAPGPVGTGTATARGARPPWTFVDMFAGLGVVLLFSVVLSGPLSSIGGSATLIVSTLPLWLGLIGTVVWACRRHGTGNLVRDLALRVRWIDLAIGLGAGLALRIVIAIWAVVYSVATGQQPTSNLEPILGESGLGTGFWLVVNLLAIGVIGPVIEEIFFRGLGLRSALASLFRRADRPRFAQPAHRARYAIAATSLIFALLHTNEISDVTSAVVLLPGLFLAGWVLGWLTIRTGRLGPGIVTHVVFNSTALVALLFLQ